MVWVPFVLFSCAQRYALLLNNPLPPFDFPWQRAINSTDGTITACYWSGNAAKGIDMGSDTAIKVEGTTTWQAAGEGMNKVLDSELGYHWAIKEGDTHPSLVENE